ncbi:MAG: hypothetical protein IJS01_10350 [Lentisphaeria bacterium]|nr:hypothetical protein [Lentisphaeria bacterium]
MKILTARREKVFFAALLFGMISCAGLRADEFSNLFDPLWLGEGPKEELSGKGWRQSGRLLKTFEAADSQISQLLKDRGFTVRNSSEGRKNTRRCKISLWRKNDRQIIVMLLELGIGETSFSWGLVDNVK